ncbi:RcpC/CpaB family pilus assembly protein [Vibrio parahaemolyticus]|uniref:RcpC/CpaB family pilus assembly protein n=1 Tax=Vibrio parahaemolyticus TaxID=670 RepID=UPI0003FFB0E2|nr:RcpC/CpaB family pilus assembly protein [Vibrio parahaemolyticus]EGR7950991.1 pilus assembly protein CpaB [Vibrio vulnificus]EGQ8926244.1 pilus assembly protein CpaB [Vibrio parahaemolyticus]EGR2948269.1 pilus assembly protein CpaB [Vibrio parahaemolyticus]EGR3067735.1 pilus assembly protein CpaB [Vibrio parahaemolyticus]EHH1218465.1 pilus assembly protein CpaB [Vibrio parahaemolyticus]
MRSRLVLIVAIAALIIGVLGVVESFKNEPQSTMTAEVIQEKNEEHIAVWMTTKPYQKGSAIDAQGVSKQQIPLSQALMLGVREDTQISFAPSILLNRSLSADEVVLPEYQVAPDQPGYIDLLISEGMTLYPLEVSDKNLINDYIRPGTFIDIVTVSSPNENLAGSIGRPKHFRGVKASVFMKSVKVLNIGDDGTSDRLASARSPSKEDGLTKVVIEVNPDALPKLALAQRTMHIEIYRSQTYTQPEFAEVRNIIGNYTGIAELRGNENKPREAL